jgi:transposase-like protein
MSILSKRYFHDEEAAFEHLEGVIWPNGPVCPHCGGIDRISKIKANPAKRVRYGLRKCGDCKRQFTAKVGTVFEHARVPLHKMLQAVHLMACSKKGVSAHQLHRILEVQYNTAWFLAHRIREALRSGDLSPLGGAGKFVESDETFIGKKKGAVLQPNPNVRPGGFGHKMKILSLVERGGPVRSIVIEEANRSVIEQIVKANVARESHLMTDKAPYYKTSMGFAAHDRVDHSAGEYVRGDAHTNTLEGYFSLFKKGMRGVYQHCSEKHLHRYLAEFDFRYNHRSAMGVEDQERAGKALEGVKGKRLYYRQPA